MSRERDQPCSRARRLPAPTDLPFSGRRRQQPGKSAESLRAGLRRRPRGPAIGANSDSEASATFGRVAERLLRYPLPPREARLPDMYGREKYPRGAASFEIERCLRKATGRECSFDLSTPAE